MTNSSWQYQPVPLSSNRLYRMCWQLENWLRIIVYVELRAACVDWEATIKKHVSNWPPKSRANDKRQYHMATYHKAALSYLTFGQLWSIISDSSNWNLFEPYFPPKDNTDARINEVKTIRNRVAHFREPHTNDVGRLELFLKDMEQGIRCFCSRYTTRNILIDPDKNPVWSQLKKEWDTQGYGVELYCQTDWLYAPKPNRMNPLINASIDILTHKDYRTGYDSGVIYSVMIHPHSNIDIVDFFNQTKSFHKDMVHIILSDRSDEVSVTIPAVHGPKKTGELILKVLSAGLNASRGGIHSPLNKEFLDWPEYVLWPDHILTFYNDNIQEPILLPD